jgi:L-ascorbate metabolism protein UlaG (beta-lactamase superfamily)
MKEFLSDSIEIKMKTHIYLLLFFVFMLMFIKINPKADTHNNNDKQEIVSHDSMVVITYIANEGFFISYSGKKILIDALFPQQNLNYPAPTAELLSQMETAQPPFDNIDLILATHIHPDHFNKNSVTRCLLNNPGAVFISTPQVIELMKMDSENYDVIRNRVKTVILEPQESALVTFNGIEVKIFRTMHSAGNMRDQNQMYLISIEDKKIFHEGDSDGKFETFSNLGLEKENIDIALVHAWFVFEPVNRKIINEYLKPNQLVLMHIANNELDSYFNRIDEIKKYFPNVTIFRNSLEYKSFK